MSAGLKWVDPHKLDLESWLAPHELELRVRVQIGSAEHSPEWTRKLLGLLAGLLRENQLPKSGRDYLAAELEKIARGGDPRALLPPRRKQKKYSPIDVLVAVEREKMKRGQKHADRFIYDSVGRRFGIKGTTAAKEASVGLSRIRGEAVSILENPEEFEIYESLFERLDLPPDHVMDLLFGSLFEK